MKYLLDTDMCIFFFQGKLNIKNKIEEVGLGNCYISEITIAELKYGAEKSSDYKRHSKEVEKVKTLFTMIPIYDSFDGLC